VVSPTSVGGIAGSNPAGGMDVVSFACYQVVVAATARSVVERSPTECGVPECDLETSPMRPRPSRAVES
jgi:hypothetical protein